MFAPITISQLDLCVNVKKVYENISKKSIENRIMKHFQNTTKFSLNPYSYCYVIKRKTLKNHR